MIKRLPKLLKRLNCSHWNFENTCTTALNNTPLIKNVSKVDWIAEDMVDPLKILVFTVNRIKTWRN